MAEVDPGGVPRTRSGRRRRRDPAHSRPLGSLGRGPAIGRTWAWRKAQASGTLRGGRGPAEGQAIGEGDPRVGSSPGVRSRVGECPGAVERPGAVDQQQRLRGRGRRRSASAVVSRAVGGVEGVEQRVAGVAHDLGVDRPPRLGRSRRSARPIAGSSSPLTASMASRIGSMSSRRVFIRQSRRFSGSLTPRRLGVAGPQRRLAVGRPRS